MIVWMIMGKIIRTLPLLAHMHTYKWRVFTILGLGYFCVLCFSLKVKLRAQFHCIG